MKKVFIDEYLSVQLRQRIDEFVDLDLDLNSILILLNNDLYGYNEEVAADIRRYIKYVIWLHKNHRDRSQAFEKYKVKTKQTKAPIKPKKTTKRVQTSTPNPDNEVLLTQLRKERKRIDEVSSLKQNYPVQDHELIAQLNHKKDKVDEILATLNDAEIQETLDEILTTEHQTQESLPASIAQLTAVINQIQPDIQFAEVKNTPDKPVGANENKTQSQKATVKTEKTLADLTFADILTEDSLTQTTAHQVDFEFDGVDDNGTQTLNDSIFLETNVLVNQDVESDDPTEFLTESDWSSSENENARIDPDPKKEPIKDQAEINDPQQDGVKPTTLRLKDQELSEEAIFDDTTISTKEALEFLDEIEEKYGDQTSVTIDAETVDLTTMDFTLAKPLTTLKVGGQVHYRAKDYLVDKIELVADYFNHQQTILTLKNLETGAEIKINAKKLK